MRLQDTVSSSTPALNWMESLACPSCAAPLQQSATSLSCANCSKAWPIVDGIPHFVESFPYWGEISQRKMQDVNRRAATGPWRAALLDSGDPAVVKAAEMILNVERANWQWLIDLPCDSKVLDLGAGTGTNAHGLAMHYRDVIALEPVIERIDFMRSRFAQEGLHNVKPLRSSLWVLPFQEQSFDLVAMNGVLEWVATGHPGDPQELQGRALKNVFRLLSPDGYLYLGIENRCAWGYFVGYPDPHCGLPFVTILPRRLADWYARRRGHSEGYRNYLYSNWGYRKLLESAGFDRIEVYLALPSYNHPRFLIPLQNNIFKYFYRAFLSRPSSWPRRVALETGLAANVLKHLEYSFVILARKPESMALAQQSETIFTEIKTAVRHTAVYGVGSLVAKALGFLMLPFYTHYLSPRDYGLLEILDLSMSLIAMLLHMGIAPALLRSYASSSSLEEKRRTVSTAFFFTSGTGLVTFALSLGLIHPVSALLFGPGVPSTYLFISLSSFILSYLASVPRAYLRALEKSGTFTMVESSSLFAMLALNIFFIAFLKVGAIGILWSSLIVNGIQAMLLSAWALYKVGIGFDARRLGQMISFGLPLIFSNIALFALNFSDRFFLQRLGSLEMVGVYAVGYKLAFMINYLLLQPFYAMWQVRMYGIYLRPEHQQIFSQIFILYSLLLTYAALIIAVFSPEIVRIMADAKFASSENVVPVVALAYVFYGVGYYLQLGMFLANKTKAIGAVSATAAILNLILNYVLIRTFGMMGAAWATLFGFMVIAAGSYWFSQRALPLRLGVRRMAAAILLAVALFAICSNGAPHLTAIGFGMKGAALLLFPLLVWKLGLLSPAEIGTLCSAGNKMSTGITRRLGWVMGR
jgi:O-antigen/teichoic acid export membrane protein/2-polyprenyl-3-methyl-5-hydroxy-6-metoxy-1,4-benzoquinol methylase